MKGIRITIPNDELERDPHRRRAKAPKQGNGSILDINNKTTARKN